MQNDPVKTPSELAEELKETGLAAADSAKNIAQASKGIGEDAIASVKSSVDDARQLGRDAASAAAAYARDVKRTGDEAADTGRAYARDAVNAAGRKIRDLRGHIEATRERSEQFVAEQPVRATLIAAAGGALFTALLLSLMRGSRRSARHRQAR